MITAITNVYCYATLDRVHHALRLLMGHVIVRRNAKRSDVVWQNGHVDKYAKKRYSVKHINVKMYAMMGIVHLVIIPASNHVSVALLKLKDHAMIYSGSVKKSVISHIHVVTTNVIGFVIPGTADLVQIRV